MKLNNKEVKLTLEMVERLGTIERRTEYFSLVFSLLPRSLSILSLGEDSFLPLKPFSLIEIPCNGAKSDINGGITETLLPSIILSPETVFLFPLIFVLPPLK